MLSEGVLLSWAQPDQALQASDPWQSQSLPASDSEGWQSLLLAHAQILRACEMFTTATPTAPTETVSKEVS